MLKSEGISFDDDDKILPDKKESLKDGMNVEVVKVDVKKSYRSSSYRVLQQRLKRMKVNHKRILKY